ncbi:MAG: hypothetical protein ACP5I8_12165 [Phycisphaerae bacterium]
MFNYTDEWISYVDRIGVLMCQQPANHFMPRLRLLCGNDTSRVMLHPLTKGPYRRKLAVCQPTREAIEFLTNFFSLWPIPAKWGSRYPTTPHYLFNEVEVALDIHTNQPCKMAEWIGKHWVKMNHRNMGRSIEGTYYSEKKLWGNMNFVRYCDNPSKITGKPCCHLETRAHSRDQIKRLGLDKVGDLLQYDYRAHWRKFLRFEEICIPQLGRQARRIGRAKKPDIRKCGCLCWDEDKRIGCLIARMAMYTRESEQVTAQVVRDYCRQYEWFYPETVMRPLNVEEYIKNIRVRSFEAQ